MTWPMTHRLREYSRAGHFLQWPPQSQLEPGLLFFPGLWAALWYLSCSVDFSTLLTLEVQESLKPGILSLGGAHAPRPFPGTLKAGRRLNSPHQNKNLPSWLCPEAMCCSDCPVSWMGHLKVHMDIHRGPLWGEGILMGLQDRTRMTRTWGR